MLAEARGSSRSCSPASIAAFPRSLSLACSQGAAVAAPAWPACHAVLAPRHSAVGTMSTSQQARLQPQQALSRPLPAPKPNGVCTALDRCSMGADLYLCGVAHSRQLGDVVGELRDGALGGGAHPGGGHLRHSGRSGIAAAEASPQAASCCATLATTGVPVMAGAVGAMHAGEAGVRQRRHHAPQNHPTLRPRWRRSACRCQAPPPAPPAQRAAAALTAAPRCCLRSRCGAGWQSWKPALRLQS